MDILVMLSPLVLIVLLCGWVIWRGLRRKPAPPPGDSVDDDPLGLNGGPGGGGTPR